MNTHLVRKLIFEIGYVQSIDSLRLKYLNIFFFLVNKRFKIKCSVK